MGDRAGGAGAAQAVTCMQQGGTTGGRGAQGRAMMCSLCPKQHSVAQAIWHPAHHSLAEDLGVLQHQLRVRAQHAKPLAALAPVPRLEARALRVEDGSSGR